jgi:hypothetical protein
MSEKTQARELFMEPVCRSEVTGGSGGFSLSFEHISIPVKSLRTIEKSNSRAVYED